MITLPQSHFLALEHLLFQFLFSFSHFYFLFNLGPTTTQPTATQPTVSEPTVTQPTVTQPTATQPTATQPTATEPTATQPSSDPTTTEKPGGSGTTPVISIFILFVSFFISRFM